MLTAVRCSVRALSKKQRTLENSEESVQNSRTVP